MRILIKIVLNHIWSFFKSRFSFNLFIWQIIRDAHLLFIVMALLVADMTILTLWHSTDSIKWHKMLLTIEVIKKTSYICQTFYFCFQIHFSVIYMDNSFANFIRVYSSNFIFHSYIINVYQVFAYKCLLKYTFLLITFLHIT